MIAPTDLGRGVWLVTGLLGLGLAGVCALLRGPADALGALVGSGLTLLNFGGLTWAAERAVAGRYVAPRLDRGERAPPRARRLSRGSRRSPRPASGSRACCLSLTLVPVAVILAGLRAARAA